jgi:hypothetical protein
VVATARRAGVATTTARDGPDPDAERAALAALRRARVLVPR